MSHFKEFSPGAASRSLAIPEGNCSREGNGKAIYGEPVSAYEKPIIPIAKITRRGGHRRYRRKEHPRRRRRWWWRSAGGSCWCHRVSNQQNRFVPITDRRKLTGALLVGIGFNAGWRKRR